MNGLPPGARIIETAVHASHSGPGSRPSARKPESRENAGLPRFDSRDEVLASAQHPVVGAAPARSALPAADNRVPKVALFPADERLNLAIRNRVLRESGKRTLVSQFSNKASRCA